MRNNFERLEQLLQDSLEENNKLNSEYETKLNEANDILRTVKTENEELKEKVEVLFKLGRGYINKHEKKQHDNPITTEDNPNEIETVHIEEITLDENEDVTNEDLQGWTKNKLRGFKRSSPTTMAEKLSHNNNKNSDKGGGKVHPRKPNTPSPESSQSPPEKNDPMAERPRFCHYYSNFGKCVYEERTGNTCRFLHAEAPMCQRGTSCTRNKCMYKHPIIAGRRDSFLDRRPGRGSTQNPGNLNPHPWMMINPWWNPGQVPVPGPWQTNMGMARH